MSNILSRLVGQNSKNKPNVEIVCLSEPKCGEPPRESATFRIVNGKAEFVRCGC